MKLDNMTKQELRERLEEVRRERMLKEKEVGEFGFMSKELAELRNEEFRLAVRL